MPLQCKCAVLPKQEAKLSKCTHLPLTRKSAVFDDKSWTKTQSVFATSSDGFSQVIRFKAFGEKK